MSNNSEVQCDYKRFLIDSFEEDGVAVQVYVFSSKKHVKQYCKDSGLHFSDGLRRFYTYNRGI